MNRRALQDSEANPNNKSSFVLTILSELFRRNLVKTLFQIIPTREIFFQPNIEADEEVAAAHFLDFELGGAGAAVPPSDGNGGETEATDDGFEREFDRDVEMRGEDGTDAVDDRAAVGFEGVSGVVEAVPEEEPDEKVRGTVEGELEGRVVDHAAML